MIVVEWSNKCWIQFFIQELKLVDFIVFHPGKAVKHYWSNIGNFLDRHIV